MTESIPHHELKKLPSFSSLREAVLTLRPDIPLRCVFPDEIAKNSELFLTKFPGTTMFAVKANADPVVLSAVYESGITHFDVGSLREVQLIKAHLPNAQMHFMHPVKSRKAIGASYSDYGVKTFAIDSYDELLKIERETNRADDLNIILRLSTPAGTALCPLNGKFGIDASDAIPLLRKAKSISRTCGLCFHVGSQTLDPTSYVAALETVAEVVQKSDLSIDVLDIGGGFPIKWLREPPPPLSSFLDAISEKLSSLSLSNTVELRAEPGRAITGTAEVLVARVHQRKDRMLYINDGTFGNMFEVGSMNWQNKAILFADRADYPRSSSLLQYEIFGPTCDTVDHMKGPFTLPDDVTEGDWIAVFGMGAYMAASCSHFNGFGSTMCATISGLPETQT